MSKTSIVGDLINFRGLVYAPLNENGVIFLFGKVAKDLNMYIEEIKPGFPDCIARRFVGKGWERVSIEFEYRSNNFKAHKHDPKKCDLVVCWEHDWPDCPIEVIELKSEIRQMENAPIKRPGSVGDKEISTEEQIEKLLKALKATENVQKWYEAVFAGVSKINDSIWAKASTKYIGWYCPEKAFVSVCLRKQSIQFECFTRGQNLKGTRVSHTGYSPRWGKFSVKSNGDIAKAVEILKESYNRIKDAIRAGEPTSYFSGGKPMRSAGNDQENNDES